MTPNLLATIALLTWPVIAVILYQTMSVRRATLWTVLGGYLILPVGATIKFEMVPQLDKNTIPNLAALAGCTLIVGRSIRFAKGIALPELLIVVLLLGPFVTSQLNGDPIRVGDRTLPGVGHYDALSAVVAQFLFIIPFFLGRQFLQNEKDIVDLLRVLVVAGLIYSLPMLFEIRMSPQLHTWVYGYFPHEFLQQMRQSGFRPVVFLGHGLLVAFFIMTTTVAATALWRTHTKVLPLPLSGVTGYLGIMIILCKSLGALVYGALLVPLVRWGTPRVQGRTAFVLALIAILYPCLRLLDLFPTDTLVDSSRALSEERAGSLKFRFDNEDRLLAHASERFLFGWGRFGRNRVFDETTGADVSVTDGHWIITMGQFGLIGFIAEFGLLAFPIARAVSAIDRAPDPKTKIFLSTLALILSINIIDQLPNSSISPWTWLLAGSLLGRIESLDTHRLSSSTTRQNSRSRRY